MENARKPCRRVVDGRRAMCGNSSIHPERFSGETIRHFLHCKHKCSGSSETRSLRTHLMVKHGDLLDGKAQTIFNTDGFVSARPSPLIAFVHNNFSFNLSMWIVDTVSPFPIVKQKSFISLLHGINVLLIVPSQNALRKIILARQSVLYKLYLIIHGTATSLSLTFEAWFSRFHRGYMSISIHWINDE